MTSLVPHHAIPILAVALGLSGVTPTTACPFCGGGTGCDRRPTPT